MMPSEAACTTSADWSFAATVPEHPVVIFHYHDYWPLWSISWFFSSSRMSMFGCAIFKLLLYSAFSVLFCSRNISIMLCMCIICCDMCIDCCACHCCIIIGSIDGSQRGPYFSELGVVHPRVRRRIVIRESCNSSCPAASL